MGHHWPSAAARMLRCQQHEQRRHSPQPCSRLSAWLLADRSRRYAAAAAVHHSRIACQSRPPRHRAQPDQATNLAAYELPVAANVSLMLNITHSN